MARCKCGATWGGGAQCHCGACHLTFTGLSAFEAHRVRRTKTSEDRDCADPLKVGMELRENGTYGSAERDPRWAAAE